MKNILEISGWVIALLSLIVNYLQYQKNSELTRQVKKSTTQEIGDNSIANQQTHTGTGHNVNAGRDANIGK